MEDRREDALQNLSPTVVAEIRSNFEAYDTDQDGGVSREEVETKVKERSEQRKVRRSHCCIICQWTQMNADIRLGEDWRAVPNIFARKPRSQRGT